MQRINNIRGERKKWVTLTHYLWVSGLSENEYTFICQVESLSHILDKQKIYLFFGQAKNSKNVGHAEPVFSLSVYV